MCCVLPLNIRSDREAKKTDSKYAYFVIINESVITCAQTHMHTVIKAIETVHTNRRIRIEYSVHRAQYINCEQYYATWQGNDCTHRKASVFGCWMMSMMHTATTQWNKNKCTYSCIRWKCSRYSREYSSSRRANLHEIKMKKRWNKRSYSYLYIIPHRSAASRYGRTSYNNLVMIIICLTYMYIRIHACTLTQTQTLSRGQVVSGTQSR